MHYTASTAMAFNSVEHIMRDVNNGWLIRYIHANGASFFFVFVYIHIGRGQYYGSYRSPRGQLWTIGVIIFILMMAKSDWPNWYISPGNSIIDFVFLPSEGTEESCCISGTPQAFIKPNIRAIKRIGPHNKEVLDQLIIGQLGDWWIDRIPSAVRFSYRFQIDQEYKHKEYIYFLNKWFYDRGYCSSIIPKTISRKPDRKILRQTLYTFSNLNWIYDSFYKNIGGKRVKVVPYWIEDFFTPQSLAALIMQDGYRQKGQGIRIATNNLTHSECIFIAQILTRKFGLKTSVVSAGVENQWIVSVWKESMPLLRELCKEYFIGNMQKKISLIP